MSDVAIRVENLSKQYRIGGPQARYKTIRESLTEAVRAPFRRLSSVVRGRASFVADETTWALKDVSLEVKRGQVVGIIGPNGAGKTTLLRILARITEPTEGYAEIHGRVGSLLEVGTGFHPELTGRENIYLNGAILGMKRAEIERKFDEIVAFSGIERFIETPVKHYSSGMYLRLAFAVASHLEPEILLVDEVLAVGDVEFQKKCLGKMEQVSREGRTVWFVSHNMAAVSNLCTEALLLDKGEMLERGSVESVIRSYMRVARSNVEVPWTDRTDRKGDGRMRFTDLRIEDVEGNVLDAVMCGQDITISLGYVVPGMERLRDVRVAIHFNTLFAAQAFVCWTDLTGDSLLVAKPNGRIRCRIPRLPLAPGQYPFEVWCKNGRILMDGVKDAGVLSVVEGDFFGTGKLPPKGVSPLLVGHSWSIEGED